LKAVPWRRIQNWACAGCGECCRLQVQLTTAEWIELSKTYGYGMVAQNIDGFFINKTVEGWCPFLYRVMGGCGCGLQQTKPLACKLWPFRISDYPRHGFKEEAAFQHNGNTFYVYGIPFCSGFRYGTPSEHFVKDVVPEFLDMRTGYRRNQVFSTRKHSAK